jgi:hypothetical protein
MRWSAATPLLLALAAAPQALAAASAPKTAAREVVPFIADDWPRALSEARAKNVPIFIEAWAPW